MSDRVECVHCDSDDTFAYQDGYFEPKPNLMACEMHCKTCKGSFMIVFRAGYTCRIEDVPHE